MIKVLGRTAVFLLASTGLIALAGGTAHAQSAGAQSEASATVSGRVFDEQTGESLQGAVVTIEGTNRRAVTGNDGRYTLTIPAGSSRISVEYIGFDNATREVSVPADGRATANFGLDSAALVADEIVVRAAATGQALAINQQRTAAGIVNVFNEEVFGPAPDGNIGYALQRLPGISVDTNQQGEPTNFNIRGVGGNFNAFQINGNRLASAGGRAANLGDFSNDGISNIEVIKAATPDRDGDAIGGIVNVVTRSAFERGGRRIDVEAGVNYRDLSEEFGYSVSANYSDLFSIGGGDYENLGVSISVGSYEIDRTSLNRDMDWVQVTPENNPQLDLSSFNGEPSFFMESSHWETDFSTTRVNTVNVDLDFRSDDSNSFYLRGFYSQSDRSNDVFETDINIDREFEDEIDGNKTYAFLTPTSGGGTPGETGSQGDFGYIGTDQDRETELWSINFGGKHEFGRSRLTYDLFYSVNEEDQVNDNELNFVMEPDNPFFLFEYELVDVERGEVIINNLSPNDPADLSLVDEGELVLETQLSREEVFSAKFDFEHSIDVFSDSELTFKTGARYFRSDFTNDLQASVFETDDAFPYAQVVDATDEVLLLGPKIYDVFPDRGVALLESNPDLFELNEEDTLEDSLREDVEFTEDLYAGYGMATLRTGIHTIIGGVRYERVDLDGTNFFASFLDGDTTITEERNQNSYDFWLPGIHFRHELTPNLILRESYNRSYGRPVREEFASGRFINEDGDIVQGNPNLRPAVSDNFDIQVEYYTETGGLYSVAVFYKDIEDFTFESVGEFDEIDANGNPILIPSGEFEFETFLNGTTAQNYGVELIARQRLVFLPGALSGFTVNLSATFTETEATFPNRDDRDDLALPGFSDTLFTASLEYAWAGFNIRGDYIYRTDYVEGLGSDIESDEFFGPEERFDLAASYQFNNGLRLFANVINLTDEEQFSYQGFTPFVEDSNRTGRTFTFGAGVRF
jgi:TonB-dependent receptor